MAQMFTLLKLIKNLWVTQYHNDSGREIACQMKCNYSHVVFIIFALSVVNRLGHETPIDTYSVSRLFSLVTTVNSAVTLEGEYHTNFRSYGRIKKRTYFGCCSLY